MSKLSGLAKITSLHVRVPEESTGEYQRKVKFQLPSDYTITLNVDLFLGSSLVFLSAYLDALIALFNYSGTDMAYFSTYQVILRRWKLIGVVLLVLSHISFS